jgi:hypothetical protein
MINNLPSRHIVANSLFDSNKKRSNNKYVTSNNLLESKDFKTFLDLYLSGNSEFFERLDGYDGFISTQQIESIDYDNFAEHVFFDSAVEKVYYSFEKTISDFPYDSTKHSLGQYIKKLDGFTKFVLDTKVAKSLNYMHFENNRCIFLKDKRGHLLSDYEGSKFLNNFNPGEKGFNFDFWLNPFSDANYTSESEEWVFHKYNSHQGFRIYTSNYIVEKNTCNINIEVSKGENDSKLYSFPLKTNNFQHISFVVEEDTAAQKSVKVYVDGKLKKYNFSINEISLDFNTAEFNQADIFIGNSNDSTKGGFNGLIDEFRFFVNQQRSETKILEETRENIHSQEGLVLYFRMNEPSGTYANNSIVIDYSGNKLHGEVKQINNGSVESIDGYVRNGIVSNNTFPLKYEKESYNPVLFSYFSQTNKDTLLENAKEYDLINPNSFWKLFPKNIFLEGSDYDNTSLIYINENTKKSSKTFGHERSQNQEIIKLLSIWARFFDQIKMYIDNLSEILNLNYDTLAKNKKIDGMILPFALNQLGFKFRELYAFPLSQKLNGKNLSYDEVMSTLNIRQIQNILWKRFMLNSKDYLMSKGTHRSIKSVFNSFGLQADKFIRIKECTGQNRLNLKNQFYEKSQRIKFIDFNGHINKFSATTYDPSTGFPLNKIFMHSKTFSTANDFNAKNEFTVEIYCGYSKKFLKMYDNKQSILRIDNVEADNSINATPYINIVFERKNKSVEYGDVKMFIDGVEQNSKIENYNLLNGSLNHVCLVKKFNVLTEKFEYILGLSQTGNLSHNSYQAANSILSSDSSTVNYKLSIGDYDNYNPNITTSFQGKVTFLRLYNVPIEDNIINLKSKDLFFIGTGHETNPSGGLLLNIDLSGSGESVVDNDLEVYNYVNDNAIGDFVVKLYDDVNIDDVIRNDTIITLSQIQSVDFPDGNNKVFVNSFIDSKVKERFNNREESNTKQVHPEYLYNNDLRLYIDFSAVNFLNQDISKLINVNEYFMNSLSNSSSLYESEYFSFRDLREKYFKRLIAKEEINFDVLYQSYKYFDNILEDLLKDAVPSKMNYLGFNFVYETHMLERNKYQHKNADSRLPVACKEEFKYQNYENNITKYRVDDNLNFKRGSTIITKV